jgi:hypothetical protein
MSQNLPVDGVPGALLTGQGGRKRRERSGTKGSAGAIRGAYGEKARKAKAPQKMRCAFIPTMTACRCCGGEFRKTRRWQRCCSRKCQLVLLAAETFFEAYRNGRADGLAEIIRELREVKE